MTIKIPPDHRSSLRYDSGAIVELRDWYNGRANSQRDWQLGQPGGTLGGQPVVYQISISSFSDLERLYYSDTDSLKKVLEEGLEALASSICRGRASSQHITAYPWREYHYEFLRHYCIVQMDVYQAINIRGIMREADFNSFMDSANQAVAQSGDGWATVQATVRRASTYAPEDVVVRDVSGIRTVYMKLGLADFTVQTHWQRTVQSDNCDQRGGAGIHIPEEYEDRPSRPDEPDGPPELGELDPPESEDGEADDGN